MFWVNWKKKNEDLVVEELIVYNRWSRASHNHDIWFDALEKLAEEMGLNDDKPEGWDRNWLHPNFARYYKIIDRAREQR